MALHVYIWTRTGPSYNVMIESPAEGIQLCDEALARMKSYQGFENEADEHTAIINREIEILGPQNIEQLTLDNCLLETLPEMVLRCKNLTELSLIGNHLKSLPTGLNDLSKLGQILLRGNGIDQEGKSRLESEFGRKVNFEFF
jgi:Leucine-rich repeat (LRR) protein